MKYKVLFNDDVIGYSNNQYAMTVAEEYLIKNKMKTPYIRAFKDSNSDVIIDYGSHKNVIKVVLND